MNYTFKIIDTKQNDHITKVERAKGGSIVLEWMGGDKKDELLIVGSRLSFTMVGMSMADGQYLDLFTGDETRYRVTQEDENGKLIWQGFLLPDSYEEPYSNAPILVNFQATDGLGRLKGKYLSDDFYNDEKSVIEILAACLRLTGLDLSFRFAPAIENSQQKDYNKIYLDTALFKDNDKKQDAYKILDDLLQSMLCTLYQADNFYNIEGLNVRNLHVYRSKVYAPDGTLTDEVEITRLKKQVTGIGKPDIGMQPPYGVVEVSQDQEPVALPEGLSRETNDGWSVFGKIEQIGVDGPEQEINAQKIFATDWYGNDGFYAYAGTEDNAPVYFGVNNGGHITIRKRPYVEGGRKYELRLNFKLNLTGDIPEEQLDQLLEDGAWVDPFELQIHVQKPHAPGIIGYLQSIIFLNQSSGPNYIKIGFNRDGESETIIQFIPRNSGLLDLKIWGIDPFNEEVYGRFIKTVSIEEAKLVELAHEDTYLAERSIEGYTPKKELKLPFADDIYGISPAFRLKKLKEPNNSVIMAVPIKRKFSYQGSFYATVSLQSANLIKENLDTSAISNIVDEVIYNWNDSQDNVVKLKGYYEGNNFTVALRDYTGVVEIRDYWRQWTDMFYQVEKVRYADAVANILHRAFNRPVVTIPDLTVKNNIKFNDLLEWDYSFNKNWMLTNCRWDIDNGFASVTAIENYYAVNRDQNIPPVVEAGDTIYSDIVKGEYQALTCEAHDPDGYIVSYEWTVIQGGGEVTIIDPNSQNTKFRIVGGAPPRSFYEFQVKVTDNDGATATDRVKVFLNTDLTFSLETIKDSYVTGGVNPYAEKHFKVVFDPDVPLDTTVLIQGTIDAVWEGSDHGTNTAYAEIVINGYVEDRVDASLEPRNSARYYQQKKVFSINYMRGDEFIIKLHVKRNDTFYMQGYSGSAYAEVNIGTVNYSEGYGNVTGSVIERAEIDFVL